MHSLLKRISDDSSLSDIVFHGLFIFGCLWICFSPVIIVNSVFDYYGLIVASVLKRWFNNQLYIYILTPVNSTGFLHFFEILNCLTLLCDSLRWASCSDVQSHKICLEVSEPLKVSVKILLHVSLQKSIQIPIQEATLRVRSILWTSILSELSVVRINFFLFDCWRCPCVARPYRIKTRFNDWVNWKVLYNVYN